MPRPAEAIPVRGQAPARAAHYGRRPATGFKRPAGGQVLQSFDAGDLVIEQWPDGRPRAVGLAWVAGVLGAGLAIAVLFVVLVRRGVRTHGDWDLLILVLVCWIGMIATVAAMARRAWRDLLLRAGPAGLTLVTGGRERRWSAGRVRAIHVYETGRADVHWPLGELQIDVGNPAGPLRLLADYDAGQLEMLARLLRTSLGVSPVAEPESTEPVARTASAPLPVQPAPSTNDPSAAYCPWEDPPPQDEQGSARSIAEPLAPEPPAVEPAPLPVAPAALDRLVGIHRSLWTDGRLKPGGVGTDDANDDEASADGTGDEPIPTLEYGQEPKRSLRGVLPLAGPVPVAQFELAGDVDSSVPLATAHRAPLAALAPADAPDSAHAPASILDYAGPRPRGGRDNLAGTRLPAVSDLRLDFEPDGGVTITETLAGKDMAIVAIAFAVIILVLVACTAIFLVTDERLPNPGGAVVLAVVFVVEFVVLLMVISNTWRRTIVRAGPTGLRLDFHALLRHPRRHHWPADCVKEMGILPLPGPRGVSDAAAPADLRIDLTDGPRLHLFTGHPKAELWPLAQHIGRALGLTKIVREP